MYRSLVSFKKYVTLHESCHTGEKYVQSRHGVGLGPKSDFRARIHESVIRRYDRS